MNRHKTNKEFTKQIYNLVGEEYEFLERYKDYKTKIKCRHNNCNYDWDIAPGNFIRGRRCPQCAGLKRRTNKEFLKEVYDLVGNEYTFLEEYINSSTKIMVKHTNCGNEYKITPHYFLSGATCKSCSTYRRTKTNDEFLKEVYDLVGNEYTFLTKYEKSSIKLLCRHTTCGYQWMVAPRAFLYDHTRCPDCAGLIKKTNEEFAKEVECLCGEEYTFLEQYVNANTKIKCKHNTCGCEYLVKPNAFLMGNRCPKCYGTTGKKNEEFVKEVYDLVGDEYTFLEEYINTKTKIKCRHNVKSCQREYYVAPHGFLRGYRCFKCSGLLRMKSNEDFLEEVYQLVGDEYTFLENYKGQAEKIMVRHNTCKTEYLVAPNNFRRKIGCRKCNSSRGENAISEYIEAQNILFECQYKNDKCRHKQLLPFDFAILSPEKEVKMLIEYDGQQHFYPVNFGGTSKDKADKNFEMLKLRDNIKNTYCKENNIPLLRIPYWDFENIEEILEKELTKLGIIVI